MALTKISENYIITNHSSSVGEVTQGSTTLTAATLVIRVVGAPSDGNTITLTDALGNSKTYEFDGNSSVSAGNVSIDISSNNSDTIYGLLKDAIEGGSGHAGQIVGTIDTSPSSYGGVSLATTLTLTQNTAGVAGNKSVSFTVHNLYNDEMPTAFAGGTGTAESLTPVAQFRLGLNNAQTIRGQTTGSYYTTFLGKPKC